MKELRNIAIIAHVDHGKTTLIDQMLRQSGALGRGDVDRERVMDSEDQEQERGITILAKNTALEWQGTSINIVDTPGHADFGGEVERILSMVDSVLLVVDAVEGPMPQTRFVTQKAFDYGLRPILMVNKIDRQGARPYQVVDEVFELFDRLGATEEQLDFPVVFGSAVMGTAGLEMDELQESLTPLFETIVRHVPAPTRDTEGPLQLQISALDFNPYVGVIGIGRVRRGVIRPGMPVTVVPREGGERRARVLSVLGYAGLERVEVSEASAGDIVCVSGIEGLGISDTLCAPECVEALPALAVDEPTISMMFEVSNSPFVGRDGRFVTSRNLGERLDRELVHNVALRVEQGPSPDRFRVSGRGELHLAVLIESMRREGYEFSVSRPEVIVREVDGERQEPYEDLVVDVETDHQGAIMEALGARRGQLQDMLPDGAGRVRLAYSIPSRGLIGFRSEFLTLTSGSGVLTSIFSHYAVVPGEIANQRINGVLVSMSTGKALAFALFNLEKRGRLLIGPGEEVYEGMVIGIHSRDNDLAVNPLKGKQLTNIRAAGSDENVILTPPIRLTLEAALEFIDDDELVEITPGAIRVRKRLLTETERKRAGRG
ncbi:MAG: translational GTPase TypA [Gammaproteobacteria bacterium]|nr:translational GTPase TypA [Gammaproteobacteria bacterium]|tara:strand:+ start:404 stop:2212 length:1809 start_codon:yes stop_codon:yes gene_type:complete